ncbi:trypsin-like peptidase domain-containing protein [Massilia sp. CF038]|uniref:trypsin-like peptidase domain-containing protein n=1 Tax=Massilia sp. CF038 TaxID=1881045 RepID=UPI000918C231|nr:trypsin-like peptidase domain-containing protein [Massilia sp. CF038]SHG49945.1 Trypsin-like peptidase domain-containing protein [Massilia sp. CF038]
MKPTLYQALGIAPDATEAEIGEAYQRCQAAQAAGEYDRNAQIILKEAFAVLSNPTKRAHYDQSLKAPRASAPEAPYHESERAAFDWRHGAAIALAAGVLSGWWFSRPKAPAAARAVPTVAAVAPEAMPVLMPAPMQQSQPLEAPAPLAGAAGDLNSEDLFAKLAPSIVRINVSAAGGQQVGIGSGVVIGPGKIITNCHVAQAGPGLQVRSGDANYDATLSLADQEHDLCRLDVPSLRAEGVAIGSARDIRTGQKVVAMGAPKGLDLTISEGIVSSLRQVDDGTLIQTTAPVSPGSSGGGLFDMHGRLVGIVTFQMTSGQNLNFAAPADWIEKMRSTKGNGIIGKLTARRDPGKDDSPTGHLPGSWSCHDTIRGSAFDIEFDAGGMVEIRKQKMVQQGRWRLAGRRIEIMGQSGPAFTVEYLSQEKLILNFEAGWRATCERA